MVELLVLNERGASFYGYFFPGVSEGDLDYAGQARKLRDIGLEKEVLERIYCKNFQRYAGKIPGKLNVELAVSECERILDVSRRNSVEHDILSQIQDFLRMIRAT
jgi:hypothetical protein